MTNHYVWLPTGGMLHHLRDCPCGKGTCPVLRSEVRKFGEGIQNEEIDDAQFFLEAIKREAIH
jgi:hypothetical protein